VVHNSECSDRHKTEKAEAGESLSGNQVMKSSSRLMLTLAFALLLVLIGVFGYAAVHRARAIYDETVVIQQTYIETETTLRQITADVYLAGLLVRDYLLDRSQQDASEQRQQLRDIHTTVDERIQTLAARLGSDESAALALLRSELQGYWEAQDPIFEWTQQQKDLMGASFLRREVLPRRRVVVKLADDIAMLNVRNLRREQRKLEASHKRFQSFLLRSVILTLAISILVAMLSIHRSHVLELRAEKQRMRIQEAEQELRQLSRRLVMAQEEERKALSRELHDEVGQMLTAVNMQVGALESARQGSPEKFHSLLEDIRQQNAQTLRAVRHLAMGLRPSMLDDLGLAPALEWQGREFSRRMGVPVTVQIEGELERLPDPQRTCIYRVVQEALTNCARHSGARNIRVAVRGQPNLIRVTVQDDGIGFEPEVRMPGRLGLLGIQERVKELDGAVEISSRPRQGTIVKVEVPVPTAVAS
jgi:signal transduction histidine kinase